MQWHDGWRHSLCQLPGPQNVMSATVTGASACCSSHSQSLNAHWYSSRWSGDSVCSWFRSPCCPDSPSWTRLYTLQLHVMERFLIFFTCFSFLASGVSICELCSALCRCDGLHGVPWFNIAGRRHHGHSIATLTCQVLRLHRSRAGQKDPQHQSWCHGHWGGSRPTFT